MSRDALMLMPGTRGLACPRGGFAIDPTAGVERAVITHAHSDHLHGGSGAYWCAAPSVPLLRRRLARSAEIVGVPYGEPFRLGEARLSFHPAGHILGSAQVRVEIDGEVWVVTGDFKREPDPTCAPFEPLRCDTLVTESTFGLPVFRWPDPAQVAARIVSWWERNAARGRVSHLQCYSLGKAQRLLAEVGRLARRPIVLQGEAAEFARAYRDLGVALPAFERLATRTELVGALVLGASLEETRLPAGGVATAFASGWVQIPSMRRGQGFVLSDHADWPGLVRTVRESGARRVVVEHGYAETFARHLRDLGLDALALEALPRLDADGERAIAGSGVAGRSRRKRDAAGMGDLFAGEGAGEAPDRDALGAGPLQSLSGSGSIVAPSVGEGASPAAELRPQPRESGDGEVFADPSMPAGIALCCAAARSSDGAVRYARLLEVLDQALSAGGEETAAAAIAAHLAELDAADAAWTVELLLRPPRRAFLPRREVLPQVAQVTGLADWLVEEAHEACGDAVETAVALLRAARGTEPAGPPRSDDPVEAARARSLAGYLEHRLQPMRTGAAAGRGAQAAALWRDAPDEALAFLVRLAGGRLRPPVARPCLERAIAAHAGLDLLTVSRRLDGFEPAAARYEALVGPVSAEEEARLNRSAIRPPMAFARLIDAAGSARPSRGADPRSAPTDSVSSGEADAPWCTRPGPWLVEWKWPGLRATLATGPEAELRGASGEPLSGRFPSIVEAARALRPAFLDGVLCVFEGERIADPTLLEPSGAGREPAGVGFVAFDLLELEAAPWSAHPLERRRAALAGLGLPAGPLRLSSAVAVADPAEIPRLRARATGFGAGGIVVKHAQAAYGDPAAWWAVPADALRFRAVLAYLQGPSRAHPRGEWALAVRRGEAWETIARVDPGLDEEDVSEIVSWARENTVERSGPVRVVSPRIVLEVECVAVDPSARRRNGLSLRRPVLVSWRREAALAEVSKWEDVVAGLASAEA